MAKRVTITDVAREAGVSIKTVSNVLNGSGSMRPETRERVEGVIERLSYRVNVSARAMKTGGIKLIGLAIITFDQPFIPYFANSVVAAARRRGYGVITDTYEYADGLAQIIPETRRLAADGWIFFPTKPIVDPKLLRQPYPLVLVGHEEQALSVDLVTMPNCQAVDFAVSKLADGGCQHIALIGGISQEEYTIGERDRLRGGTGWLRTQGYVQALERHGLTVNWGLVRNDGWVQAGGRDAIAALLDDPDLPTPDGIMCLNDAMAIGVIHELQRRGIRVPQDVQICGFDNVPESEDCIPALTTIDPHADGYAAKAVNMLIDRIEGNAAPPQAYVTGFDLIERDSTL